MEYAKPGDIKKKCAPNAIMTFLEYLLDYASEDTKKIGTKMIEEQLQGLNPKLQENIKKKINKIHSGERDIYV